LHGVVTVIDKCKCDGTDAEDVSTSHTEFRVLTQEEVVATEQHSRHDSMGWFELTSSLLNGSFLLLWLFGK